MSKNTIKTKDNHGFIFQDSSLAYNYYNYDLLMTVSQLLNNGNIDEAKELLSNLSKTVAGHHPLYPYYSTEIENRDGKLVFTSKPNSDEATKKYPPIYKGKVIIPEEYKNFLSMNELSNYANRNQVPIDLNLLEFKKFLGDIPDPYQELDDLIEENGQPILRIIPKEFPPAMPFKVILTKSNYTLDYILLRMERITDDNELIVSNKEQKIGIYISLTINEEKKKADFHISIKEEYMRDVSSNLAYANIMKYFSSGDELKIVSLEDGNTLLQGFTELKEDPFNNEYERKIELFNNLKIIEDYYGVKIEIADQILMTDAMNAETLAKAIEGEEVVSKYNYIDTEFRITKESKKSIRDFHNSVFMMSYEIYDFETKIFNHSFKIPKIVQKVKKVKMADEEKVIKKLDVLEEGDIIKIKFIPANEETIECSDIFYFE